VNILVFNPGSSSLRFGCYEVSLGKGPKVSVKPLTIGHVEKIGVPGTKIIWDDESKEEPIVADNTAHAAKEVMRCWRGPVAPMPRVASIDAIGCRVVHGGSKFLGPELITDQVLKDIRELAALAPLHNTSDAAVIEAVCAAFPNRPVVAVFDTSFHRTLPAVAATYALPVQLSERYHLRRYGFHGIAHQFVSERLVHNIGPRPKGTRLITCHLGNGASVCALRNGESIDTSMGLTPLEGLVMGTRSGDLDPGLVLYLMRVAGLSAAEVEDLLNHQSGLLGLFDGRSSDLRDIVAARLDGDRHAELALDLFCYRIAKYIGAYSIALDGLDAVAFSGGVGEHSSLVRERVCRRLGLLGVELDEERNTSADGQTEVALQKKSSLVQVWLIPANENLQIARDVHHFLEAS
jgi:acetate kinase